MTATSSTDERVRLYLYGRFVATGAPPTVAQTAGELGLSEDRLAPGWRRRTPAEAEAVFAELGLAGDFWRLGAEA